MTKILVSSCLLGLPLRYDGKSNICSHPIFLHWQNENRLLPICPEVLGGLSVPRPAAEIQTDGKVRHVFTRDGKDVSAAFNQGANLAIEIAKKEQIKIAILKEGSPSCGSTMIHDGTFSKQKIPGAGITAGLLKQAGILVFSEYQIEAAANTLQLLESRNYRTYARI